ncbi:MAG: glycosyl hydrolase [Solirubrobacterales bacterium]
MASRRWLGLALAAALACLLGTVPAAGAAMYWGGTIKGSVYGLSGEAPTSAAVVSRFEADAGKAITFVNTGQPWAQFDRTTMDAAIATGTIPLVTMGLAEGVTLKDVVGGKQDKEIRAWAKAAREFGYPFLFRPWWEVNGDWYSWGRSPEYIAAWRHFHDLVVEEGATNVTWAWVVNSVWWDSTTESWGPSDPTPYYPGAAYVDWVGMDAYNWGLNPLQPDKWRTPTEVIGPTLEILEGIAPSKPVCICEGASTEKGREKGPWINSMLGEYLPAHPSIKAYLWFNWNVEQGGQPGTEWDWPIESSPAAQAAFRAGIQSDVYLSSLPPLTKLAKVPVPVLPTGPEPPAGGGAAGDPPAEPTSTGPADSHGGPAAQLALGRPSFDSQRGTAAVSIRVPGPGVVRLEGKRALAWIPVLGGRPARHSRRQVAEAGGLLLRVAPDGPTRLRLARTGRAEVAVVVTFTSSSGVTRRRAVKLTLRVSPAG